MLATKTIKKMLLLKAWGYSYMYSFLHSFFWNDIDEFHFAMARDQSFRASHAFLYCQVPNQCSTYYLPCQR